MSDLLKSVLLEQPLSEEAATLLAALRPGEARFISKGFEVEDDPWKDPHPRFVFRFIRRDGVEQSATQAYSDKFDDQLYKWHVQMDKPEDESVRVGTRLLSNLRYADLTFGKDYTDHVLWEVLSERFGQVRLIREALDQVSHYEPELTEGYAKARNYIETCVTGLGNSIVVELRYADPQAFAILVGAAWYGIEQRHSLRLRRLLSLPK